MIVLSHCSLFRGTKHAKSRLIAFANQAALCQINLEIARMNLKILIARFSMILKIKSSGLAVALKIL
jgi:hypothetical protein